MNIVSKVGRFISEDTYEGDTKNPLSLNLYTYVYNNPTRYHDPSGNIPVLVALIGKQVLNYGLDVMIGVGTDYLDHLNTKSGTFNVKASIKKNAKESIVPGLGFLKKVKKAYKLADRINDTLKKGKKAKKKTSQNTGRSGKQARLKEIANDDKVSTSLGGEIKRDINQINRGKRDNVRVPQGYQMAHRRGYEARKGYGYEHSDLQNTKNHKTQHKYDNNGKKRK